MTKREKQINLEKERESGVCEREITQLCWGKKSI